MDNLNDIISREAAIKEILKICPKNTKPGSFDEYGVTVLCGVIDVILKQLPAVDAAPVVHGRLIKYEPDMHGTEPVKCSVCNYLFARLYPQNYCPNCGAKLDAD